MSSAAERLPAADVLFAELLEPSSSLRRRLPVVGSLSLRFGSTLLRRVAERLDAVRKKILFLLPF